MISADSDVLIDALRGREPARARIAQEIGSGGLATTVISVFELYAGARGQGEIEKVEALLSALPILPLDEEASQEAGRIHRELARRGDSIGPADCLIAGICLLREAVLLTRNRAHFERVPGLKVGAMA